MEGMKLIDDKSINLIHTDPPYNIGIAEWDKIPDYVEWCGKWIKECERVLKDNGSFYFWHNDMSQIPQIMEWIRQNTGFVFNSFITWDKGEFRAKSWKNPMPDNNLRSWFNTCEYCLFYTFQDNTGLEKITEKFIKPNNKFAEYLKSELQKAKVSNKEISKLFPSKTGGLTGCVSNWLNGDNIITKNQYLTIKKYLGERYLRREYEDLRREYEDLRREYEDLRREYEDLRFTHNLDKNHNNVWRFNSPQDRIHICEKPQEIVQRIVKCSSNKNDIVLDLFAGSASTAIASYKLNRNYICFEKDSTIFNKANTRLEAVKSQISIFDEPEPTEKWEQIRFI